MQPGQTRPVLVIMRNTGTATWSSVASCRLGSQSPPNNTHWGISRVDLPTAVPPGGLVTIPFSITAPAQPGRYVFRWRMLQDNDVWFGAFTDPMEVTVVPRSANDPRAGDGSRRAAGDGGRLRQQSRRDDPLRSGRGEA
jgi:hypothetical protein